jgi:hypothetical protein
LQAADGMCRRAALPQVFAAVFDRIVPSAAPSRILS